MTDYEDGALFQVSSSGEITFLSNPDYESKSVYKVKINISDGTNTITQVFTVILNDICDHEILPDSGTYAPLASPLREDYESQINFNDDNHKSNSVYRSRLFFDSSDYDVCAAPDFDETYDLTLSGDDASFFKIVDENGVEVSQANDGDYYEVYFRDNKFDYEMIISAVTDAGMQHFRLV